MDNNLGSIELDESASTGGKADDVLVLDGKDDNCNIVVPEVGMVFDDVDKVYEFYRLYAVGKGFGCKIRSSRKDGGILRHVTIACVREGKHKTTSVTPFELDPTGKCECKARITACLGWDDKWMITVFVSEHTHRTSPSKARFMRCNKFIKKSVKRRIITNDKAGIRMCQNFNSFAAEAGGPQNLPFDEKDLRNMLAKEKYLELREGDATALYDYFERMKKLNPDFYHRIDMGKHNRLKNVFWADKRCREAYKEFGEVVTFDTTYLTNKYDMPFAPFVGVNHHGQSILFGCGLLSNQEIPTFVWLFETWLDCMGGSAPLAIITDQDAAMKSAVKQVFPKAKHRWCLWHIMKKIPEKLSGYDKYLNIKCRLKRAVYDTQCPAEFEQGWSEMLEKYPKLKSNRWLNDLYGEKNRWVPCYLKTTFWAGMSTTQRSESMNAFFDGYVHSRTCLKEFAEKFDNALRYKLEKELKEDARSFSKVIPTTTSYEIEKQMQSVYTIQKFQEIQKELTNKIYCEIINVEDEVQDGNQVKKYDIQQEIFYHRLPLIEDEEETSVEECATASADQENTVEVSNLVAEELEGEVVKVSNLVSVAEEIEGEEIEKNPKTELVMKHVVFKVWFQKDGCKVRCSCCRFESRGILCTHAIFVLLRNNVTSIPDCYILRRWRKDVKLAHTKVPLTSNSWELTPDQMRYKELCDYFAELADVACVNEDRCNDISKWICEQLKKTIEERPVAAKEVISSVVNESNEVRTVIEDPPIVPKKGRPTKERLKPKEYRKRTKKGKENIEVPQEIPAQQSMVGTVQPATVNLTGEYHQLLVPSMQLTGMLGGPLANGMVGVPRISPYGNVVNAYGASHQWDYGCYGPTYGGFQLHGPAHGANFVSPNFTSGPPLQTNIRSGFSQNEILDEF